MRSGCSNEHFLAKNLCFNPYLSETALCFKFMQNSRYNVMSTFVLK